MSSGLSACSRLSICSPPSTSSSISALLEGLLVTLTLDPLSMLAPFNNPKLNAACLELESKRCDNLFFFYCVCLTPIRSYLAVVGLKPLETANSQTFEFHLLSQGLAKIMPGLGVNSAMCVPIHPETDHPTRESLQMISFPLPLPNCYYHSHNSTVLLDVSHFDGTSFREVRVSPDGLERLDQIGLEDAEQSAAVRCTLKPRPEADTLSQRMPLFRLFNSQKLTFNLGPLMPFHDTVLPLPILRPWTLNTSNTPSAIDMFIQNTVAHAGLRDSPPQCATPRRAFQCMSRKE